MGECRVLFQREMTKTEFSNVTEIESPDARVNPPLSLSVYDCVQSSDGDAFCLVDNKDGTADVTSVRCGLLWDNFPVGYDPTISANEQSGELFIDTVWFGYFSLLISSDTTPFAELDSAWRQLPNLSVPYDFDWRYNDGCHGRDPFGQDAPIELSVVDGVLRVKDYRIIPGVLTKKLTPIFDDHKNQWFLLNETDKNDIRNILDCALKDATDPNLRLQLVSALAMVSSDSLTNLVLAEGPYSFSYADINLELNDKTDISISSVHHGTSNSVSSLNIDIRPSGLANLSFGVDPSGMVFSYNRNCGYTRNRVAACETAFITLNSLDPEEKELALAALEAALGMVERGQDKETIQTIIEIVTMSEIPTWLR